MPVMRILLLLFAASLLTVPVAVADHTIEHSTPLTCEDGDPSGVCMDYCMYGLGPSYGIAILHGGDVLRVWFPECPIM